jgi:hypothetical protein
MGSSGDVPAEGLEPTRSCDHEILSRSLAFGRDEVQKKRTFIAERPLKLKIGQAG